MHKIYIISGLTKNSLPTNSSYTAEPTVTHDTSFEVRRLTSWMFDAGLTLTPHSEVSSSGQFGHAAHQKNVFSTGQRDGKPCPEVTASRSSLKLIPHRRFVKVLHPMYERRPERGQRAAPKAAV